MNNSRAIRVAIDKGARYLASQQRADGGFDSYSSPRANDFGGALVHQTTFFPSLILLATAQADHEQLKGLRDKIAGFLLRQKNDAWSFNYWNRDSQDYTKLPYPDDLDDTFLALSALWHHDKELLDGAAMAKVSQLLIAAEQEVGGPYRTWLTTDGDAGNWHDVDVAVNANIAYFLAQQDVRLPSINRLVEKVIADQALRSPYYPNELPIVYYLARWYGGDATPRLSALCRQAHVFDNPLHAALAASSLIRLGEPARSLGPYAAILLDTQLPDGSWPAYAFCVDPARQGQRHFAGSPSLTTALCIEALSLLAKESHEPKKIADPRYERVMSSLSHEIKGMSGSELRQQAKHVLARIRALDSDKQVILLPWLVQEATGLGVANPTLHQLAMLSAWGWMAYTTFDDFLDNEGAALSLPAAIVALRKVTLLAGDILPGRFEFRQEALSVLDGMDAANTWELAHCRAELKHGRFTLASLPDYGDYWPLAARSYGHALSGLGVLYAAGLGRNSQMMVALRKFFWHYLIARQLNDDAHDWQEDLRRGHINAVAAMVLERYGRKTVNTNNLQPLQEIFWDTCIDKITQLVHEHASIATAALTPTIARPESLTALLVPLENSANEAIAKREKTQDFINNL